MPVASGATPAIDVAGLTVVRGRTTVLEDFNVCVPAGKVVGLLGPSGCGKSTLLRAIVGVQQVKSGRVTVLGEPAGHRRLRSRVGYVTQAPSVYADLSVRENLAYFAAVLGIPRVAMKLELERILGLVDLERHARSRVDALSGGERSRVSLAAALLGRPELLVLDEPTVGLDPLLRTELWGLFRQLAARGTTLLISSHVMDEARRCDRLLLMRDGALLADDTLDGLLSSTQTPDVESAFLRLVGQGAAGPAV